MGEPATEHAEHAEEGSGRAGHADRTGHTDRAGLSRTQVPRDRPREGAAVWHHRGDKWLALGVWTERRAGLGEDADPLLVHHGPTREGIVGVFDGAGGAGAAVVWRSRDGLLRTGAWAGSRMARACVESWFLDGVADGTPFEAEELRGRLAAELAAARPRTTSKIISSMRRDLPSTMAAIRYKAGNGGVECEALWAGDSRAYALTPGAGLRALTRDHTVETDALEQLLQDPPLTNMLCADRAFTVEAHRTPLDTPCVLVCATDGFFGYVETPSDFERHLLGTLAESRDERDWAERLADRVSGYSADDASLSLAAFGFAGLDDLREGFGPRLRELEEGYAGAEDGDQAARTRWRERAWQDYRRCYEELMPPPREGTR
ncbi:hypothetical protein Ssi03_20420 [Sphaerisporangium siamense]|uniref:Serine/threonine protein phosphatase PrpC n=1 Tax=Sphaerisporangium siamense TaxID=795645 RepID=A0A7W7DEW8_9ACTN|nr:protein phosphatase 2C domain-containing protein [Sphaerisporangium siamense]MBB4705244.1 serine/threonine protein phosphatase PrpC [Sphaerisporangium siamense]GII84052.1 hypothetical protein Ssi03_20420 [Sphaerisporangium siamense]